MMYSHVYNIIYSNTNNSNQAKPGSRESPGEDTAHIPRKHLCLALPGNAAPGNGVARQGNNYYFRKL